MTVALVSLWVTPLVSHGQSSVSPLVSPLVALVSCWSVLLSAIVPLRSVGQSLVGVADLVSHPISLISLGSAFGQPFGQPSVSPSINGWSAVGQPLVSLWSAFWPAVGQPISQWLVSRWSAIGQALVGHWSAFGQPLVSIGSASNLSKGPTQPLAHRTFKGHGGEATSAAVLGALAKPPWGLDLSHLRASLSVIGGDGATVGGGPDRKNPGTRCGEFIWTTVHPPEDDDDVCLADMGRTARQRFNAQTADADRLHLCVEWDKFHRQDIALSRAIRRVACAQVGLRPGNLRGVPL